MQVRITIRGRQYTVRGDDSEEAVQAVARDLDARLAEVAGQTRSFDEYTIALLTALNLASELHRLRERVGGQHSGWRSYRPRETRTPARGQQGGGGWRAIRPGPV